MFFTQHAQENEKFNTHQLPETAPISYGTHFPQQRTHIILQHRIALIINKPQ